MFSDNISHRDVMMCAMVTRVDNPIPHTRKWLREGIFKFSSQDKRIVTMYGDCC